MELGLTLTVVGFLSLLACLFLARKAHHNVDSGMMNVADWLFPWALALFIGGILLLAFGG